MFILIYVKFRTSHDHCIVSSHFHSGSQVHIRLADADAAVYDEDVDYNDYYDKIQEWKSQGAGKEEGSDDDYYYDEPGHEPVKSNATRVSGGYDPSDTSATVGLIIGNFAK